MGTNPRVHSDSSDWLSDEKLAWRPEIAPQRLIWQQLKQLRRYEKKLRHQRITEPVNTAQQRIILNDASEYLMQLCFAMMGRAEKPRSVTIYQILRRLWLPTRGLHWRQYLWFRMLHWEFYEWACRITEQSRLSHDRTVEALLQRLPQSPGEQDRLWPHRNISGEPTNAEAAVLWRWVVSRGRRMSRSEWSDFTSRFTGIP